MELLIISILWVLLRNRSFRRAAVFVDDALRIAVSKGIPSAFCRLTWSRWFGHRAARLAPSSARGKPIATHEPVKICLDTDVLAALRDTGEGWQTRINDTWRASLQLAG